MKIHKLLDSSIAEPEKFNKDVHAIIEKEGLVDKFHDES